jgi:hypothetical protein
MEMHFLMQSRYRDADSGSGSVAVAVRIEPAACADGGSMHRIGVHKE